LTISCTNSDEKVKNESESNNIKVTIDSTTETNNEQHTPIDFNGKVFEKDELVHTAKINNSKYELYKNMVIIDTSGSYDWSVTSLSIHKNGTKQKVLLKLPAQLLQHLNSLREIAYKNTFFLKHFK